MKIRGLSVYLNKKLIISVIGILTTILVHKSLQASEQIVLNSEWQIQAARNSSIPPDDKLWTKARPKEKNIDSLWYEQPLPVPDSWTGKRIFLDFRRIEGDAIIFVNGFKIGELLRPGGEIEITSNCRPGQKNSLLIFVTRAYTDISRKFEDDKLRRCARANKWVNAPKESWKFGITAPVTLIGRPSPIGISDVFVQTSWRSKEIAFDVELDSSSAADDISLAAEITETDGRKVMSFSGNRCAVSTGCLTLRIAHKWENPTLWELDGGHLYTARVKLIRNGVEIDATQPISFGFREVWTEGKKLMLNGHETRLRLLLWRGSGNKHAVSFFRLMGYNAAYIQPNPTMWWSTWNETPIIDDELLDTMDKAGFTVMLPSPTITHLRDKLLKDDGLRKDFERETDMWIRRYRNHPSVMAWIVGMITYCPIDNCNPREMGRRYGPGRADQGMPKVITTACSIVKKYDPTRLAYSHGDGNVGDISSFNMYLNFVPLQEREEWPMSWAESGDMPYMMCEFGQPFAQNFWKANRPAGKSFLPTEFFAIYFGEKAYDAETDIGLGKLVDYGIRNNPWGPTVSWTKEYPMYWDFQQLFVRQTNRAFRTWGINAGWAYWNLRTGFGTPPGASTNEHTRYVNLKEDITEKPAWANEDFNIYSQANKPLLTYIAGWPRHTDKTHTWFSGERVEKAVAVVWDGPGNATLKMRWQLRLPDGSVATSGNLSLVANPGDIRLLPISFSAPSVKERTVYVLELTTEKNGKDEEKDSFSITVFPRQPEPVKLHSKLAVWDPVGKSLSWIKELGINATEWKPKEGIKDVDMLVIGREALKPGEAMPYSAEDVRKGLKVVVLEQRPEVWRGLGFRTTEAMPRLVFPADAESPILKGLDAEDLRYWRGSPDLLPEGKNQPAETRHAPKWTNTNAIASSVPQIPRCTGFTPILSCEFDMDYSPLLEFRDGKGIVIFSALDLSGRAGVDPAATSLAKNLFSYVDQFSKERTKASCYVGDDAGLALLKRLGVEVERGTPEKGKFLIVGSEDTIPVLSEIENFASGGGQVFLLPQSKEKLSSLGFKTEQRSIQRVQPDRKVPVLRAIGRSLLRWRETIEFDAFSERGQPEDTSILAGGLLAQKKIGTGTITMCQVTPSFIERLHVNDKDKAEAVRLSVFRLEQFVSRLLTNLGASPAKASAARLCWLDLGPQVESLNYWNLLGPYLCKTHDGESMLAEKFPGEEMSVAGDTNPNSIFKRSDGVQLDWRPTIKGDEKGFMNLGAHYKMDSSATVAYAVTTVESDTDREAVLRLGCDWFMRVWVNGEEVFKTLNGLNKPAAYSVKVHLRKGVNTVSCKVGSGTHGYGFYADISKPAPTGTAAMSDDLKGVSFYAGRKFYEEFDPYEFFYW